MNKTIIQKIDELNEYCEYSLSFTYFDSWEVSNYHKGMFFNPEGKLYEKNGGYLEAKTFEGIVNKAYKAMLKDKKEKNKMNKQQLINNIIAMKEKEDIRKNKDMTYTERAYAWQVNGANQIIDKIVKFIKESL